ncbi:hypothetical protein PFISCL1PPCAC_20786, partial [Pristionchus fissidentatus]
GDSEHRIFEYSCSDLVATADGRSILLLGFNDGHMMLLQQRYVDNETLLPTSMAFSSPAFNEKSNTKVSTIQQVS